MEKNVPGVGIILIHKDKFLLQHRDDKQGIPNPNKWGLVGGGVDEGETPEEAIKRECSEEIGVIPRNITYIGKTTDNKSRFYAYLEDDEVDALRLGEGQEIRFFAPEEVLSINLTPRVEMFFKTYSNAVQKFIRKENVVAKDFGLE
ncbi:MAG TPA: NUDIX domain-containing protein [Parachlamydiaceae bacterium]|nr:NUDIX domain-containing protein [Parachlamydiaceae bacterium]